MIFDTIAGIVFGLLIGLGGIVYIIDRAVFDPLEPEIKRRREELRKKKEEEKR